MNNTIDTEDTESGARLQVEEMLINLEEEININIELHDKLRKRLSVVLRDELEDIHTEKQNTIERKLVPLANQINMSVNRLKHISYNYKWIIENLEI